MRRELLARKRRETRSSSLARFSWFCLIFSAVSWTDCMQLCNLHFGSFKSLHACTYPKRIKLQIHNSVQFKSTDDCHRYRQATTNIQIDEREHTKSFATPSHNPRIQCDVTIDAIINEFECDIVIYSIAHKTQNFAVRRKISQNSKPISQLQRLIDCSRNSSSFSRGFFDFFNLARFCVFSGCNWSIFDWSALCVWWCLFFQRTRGVEWTDTKLFDLIER